MEKPSLQQDREVHSQAERSRERHGWVTKIATALVLVILLLVCFSLGSPRPFGGSEIVLAAAILGVSIAFTGVLVPCVFLIYSRSRVVTEMLEDVTDIQSQLERGSAIGLRIRQYGHLSKARE